MVSSTEFLCDLGASVVSGSYTIATNKNVAAVENTKSGIAPDKNTNWPALCTRFQSGGYANA
jgi:hypothetical protein